MAKMCIDKDGHVQNAQNYVRKKIKIKMDKNGCPSIQKLSTILRPYFIRKRSYTPSYPHYPHLFTTLVEHKKAVKYENLFCKL